MPITQTAEGDTFLHTDLISSTYVQPDITPERAYRWFTENIHLRNNIVNLSAQVFQGPAEITVIDTDTDEIHPDLSEWMRSQCARLSLDTQMKAAWSDCMWAGAAVKSVGYGRRNGTYTITEIRHLPAITFREAPPEYVSYNNPLLPGITYDTKRGEVRLFQAATGGFITRELQNFTIVRDPNTPFPGGLSYCLPVYPVVAAIDVANQAANQQVMRTGAPLIFPKFEQMNDSMKEWGKNFVRRWGKNVGFTIPPGVEFVDPQIHETDTAAARLEMLIKWVDSYFNPTTVLD